MIINFAIVNTIKLIIRISISIKKYIYNKCKWNKFCQNLTIIQQILYSRTQTYWKLQKMPFKILLNWNSRLLSIETIRKINHII